MKQFEIALEPGSACVMKSFVDGCIDWFSCICKESGDTCRTAARGKHVGQATNTMERSLAVAGPSRLRYPIGSVEGRRDNAMGGDFLQFAATDRRFATVPSASDTDPEVRV
ncbi:hypothetical protein [Nocardia carnea]|uniref:hypothetical protein n=1 Tax=Nocardia carnea TaxID=37328 RepID=UPI00245435B5|nr:hypothetical protein [Nocardia carnea]